MDRDAFSAQLPGCGGVGHARHGRWACSGSTAAFAIEALAQRDRQGRRFVGIPTSDRTAAQAAAADIALTSSAEHRQIDLTIDGADEVEQHT